MMSKWIKCKDRLPEEDGLYLTADIVIADVITYHTRYFAHDLHKVDDIDFADYKGVSGWYYYDDEYGYYECDAEAWMPIEPYSRKDEPQTDCSWK